jgi:hypothetical protein
MSALAGKVARCVRPRTTARELFSFRNWGESDERWRSPTEETRTVREARHHARDAAGRIAQPTGPQDAAQGRTLSGYGNGPGKARRVRCRC